MSFNNKTIEELHNLLVSKEISATELTQATLDDIKAREEAVNAFVTVAEEAALAQAKAIDEKGIDADNLLSGIPLAVKDNISTDGILTTAASKMLYNYEPFWKIEHKDKSIRQLIQSCPAHEMDYGAKLGKLETKGDFLYLLDKQNEVVSRISVLK